MNRGWSICLGAARAPVALLLAMGAALPLAAAPLKFEIATDYRLGYDTNAFLSTGKDLASGYFETTISPKVSRRTAKGEVSLSGYYDATRYLKHYGSSSQYGGALDFRQRISPKLNVFGALHYDSEVIGQGSHSDDVTGPPVDNTDVNLIGQRRRSKTLSATGGWEYQMSPKDSISADGELTSTSYKGAGGDNSRNYGGRVGWRHAVNARTKIGLSGSVYYIDYDTRHMSTMIMEPDVTFSTELSPTWHFDAAIGVTFSKQYLPLPLRDSRTKGLSGNINLCHKAVKDDFCLYAGRSVTGSGLGGSIQRTQLGASYHRRLTETLSWTGSANYTRSKSQSGGIATREYVSARGGVDWLAKRWLTIGVEGRYRDVFGGRQVRGDYGGEVNATIYFPARP